MWTAEENYTRRRGFYTPPPPTSKTRTFPSKPWLSEKRKNNPSSYSDHNNVPHGDSPYVRAKYMQMVEKDPAKAISMFWNAINSGDRVDSALKDMAAVMKQLDRSDEAIEAIRSFRHLCTPDSQESLDNVLVELYKHSGRLEEEVEVLLLKLKQVEEGNAFGRNRVKLARSQGKRIHITAEQEYARLSGNLAWAYLQLNDYRSAEEYYRKALSIETDRNNQCNLAVCLMCMSRIAEAKLLLQTIETAAPERKMDESFGKSFERALELLARIEFQQGQSSTEDEKENNCSNVSTLTFTPYKKPHEPDEFNSRRILADQHNELYETQKGDSNLRTRSYLEDVPVCATGACYMEQTTGTPIVPARGLPNSPFTQPWKDSRNSTYPVKTTYTPPVPVHRLPSSPFTQPRRRLLFEKPAESRALQSRVPKCRTNQHEGMHINQIENSSRNEFSCQRLTTTVQCRSNSFKTTCTPQTPVQRVLPSPLTQPRKDSCISDEEKWRKGTHQNETVSHLQRRLLFDKPTESGALQSRDSESGSNQHEGMGISQSEKSCSNDCSHQKLTTLVQCQSDYSFKTTYTPSIPVQRLRSSPFTQPRKDSSASDGKSWQKGTETVSHSQRRLLFQKPAVSSALQSRESKCGTNQHEGMDASQSENCCKDDSSRHQLTTSVQCIEISETTQAEYADRNSSSEQAEYGWDLTYSKGKKSWADMADEDEEEERWASLSKEIEL